MLDCLFCKIINKEIPAEIVYEDGVIVAFLDIHPKSPGHTVVVSRVHSSTILDLPDVETGKLFVGVKRVTELLQRTLNPAGFTTGINHGSISGQTVAHLHVHVLPRFDGDRGGSIHTVLDNPPKESVREMGEKIRSTPKS